MSEFNAIKDFIFTYKFRAVFFITCILSCPLLDYFVKDEPLLAKQASFFGAPFSYIILPLGFIGSAALTVLVHTTAQIAEASLERRRVNQRKIEELGWQLEQRDRQIRQLLDKNDSRKM